MLSVSETSPRFYIFRFCSFLYFFAILNVAFFFKGDRGLNLRSSPLSLFDPQPLHALQLIVLRTDYVMLHSASSMLI